MSTLRCLVLLASVATSFAAAPSVAGADTIGFRDSFDGARAQAPLYGLNDALSARQQGPGAVTYTRRSGRWHTSDAPAPSVSQVGHPDAPGALSLRGTITAVRLDAPVVAAADGRVVAQATADPFVGDHVAGDWASLVLTPAEVSNGYVSNADVSAAMLVGSGGAVEVFHAGALVWRGRLGPPDAEGRYGMALSYAPGDRTLRVTVGGQSVDVPVGTALPGRVWAHLGTYLSAADRRTTFDDLGASAVDRSAVARPPGAALRHLGYFAARITPEGSGTGGGNHLPEVQGRTNLNWVQISDFARYAPEVLDACAPGSCIVSTGHELFTGCTTANSPDCRLHPDHRARWERLAAAVRPRLDKVAAFYLLDEPFHHGATAADVATAARLIRATFPDRHVMLVEAGPAVDRVTVPAEVDWVGMDWYCRPMSDVRAALETLKARAPGRGVFLFPEAAPLQACGGAAGHATDADVAALQWEYLALAESDPAVIGLLYFGFWVSGFDAAELPATVDAHERIAARTLPTRPVTATPPVTPPAATPPATDPGRRGRGTVRVRKRQFRLAVRCPARCRVGVRVTADRSARRRLRVPVERRYPLGSGHARRKRAGVAQVRVRIRRAAARKLRRAALRRVAATARITVRIPGDTRRSTRPLTLVLRR